MSSNGNQCSVWCLRHKLLQSLSDSEMARMATIFTETRFPARHIIFTTGDAGDRIYLIREGHVRMYRLHEDGKEITLGILGRGDIFGELALFGVTQRATIAESLDDVSLCSARADEFLRLMAHMPQLTMQIGEIIARRRLQAEMLIEGLAHVSVRGRLMMVLRQLVQDFGEPCEGGTKIGLRLSHRELAALAGTTRETCTVEMGVLERKGLIKMSDEHCIIIPAMERLVPPLLDRLRTAVARGM